MLKMKISTLSRLRASQGKLIAAKNYLRKKKKKKQLAYS